MNIILVSNRIAKPKSLSGVQIFVFLISLLGLCVFMTTVFLSEKNKITNQEVVKVMSPAQFKKATSASQMHLDAYAKQLGKLQARIMRLDDKNKRLVKLASIPRDKVLEKRAKDTVLSQDDSVLTPSVGGPLVNTRPMTEVGLQEAIAELAFAVGSRDEYMNLVETDVIKSGVMNATLPNANPVSAGGYLSSDYGWRMDPISGNRAFHQGLDFTAPKGTEIHATADGIVMASFRSLAYGNIVKLNHGEGLETRYAHASKLLVKSGERVTKGQVIALVGSTGRSTGPHLHYEIRLNGKPLNPIKYLNKKLK